MSEREKIAVWGLGYVSSRYFEKLKKDFDVEWVLDTKKAGARCGEITVMTYEEAEVKIRRAGAMIVILTSARVYAEISEYLEGRGLKEGTGYCWIEDFITEYYWKGRNEACLSEIHVCVTSRCTLKCRNCNMFVPYYREHVDYTAEELKRDADLLFSHVDYVFNYVFLGGEPFLNEEALCGCISHIRESYGDKLGRIGIVTNATCIPGAGTLALLKKYGVQINISDYSHAVPYGARLEQFKELLTSYEIPFLAAAEQVWCDFGFPGRGCSFAAEDPAKHMRLCRPLFHGLNDRKLYYCHVAWSAEKTGLGVKLEEKDFIRLECGGEDIRERLMEHYLGKIEGGFVSFCRMCGGCGSDNTDYVTAGKQLEAKAEGAPAT